MAQRGRPKLVENMQPWELREHRNKQGMKQLTTDQLEAIRKAREALCEFNQQWSETYDLYDMETPRKLDAALCAIQNSFPKEEDELC